MATSKTYDIAVGDVSSKTVIDGTTRNLQKNTKIHLPSGVYKMLYQYDTVFAKREKENGWISVERTVCAFKGWAVLGI